MVTNALFYLTKTSCATYQTLLPKIESGRSHQHIIQKDAMEYNNRLVVIELNDLEAMIERVVERKLREVLNQDNKTLGRDGRMSLKEVMSVLDISKQCVYNWIKDGKLPQPTRIGRRLYWSPDAIKSMLP